MKKGIIICGMNGAGKSTLAKAFAEETGFICLDIEDFYFPDRSADNPYALAYAKEEVEKLLLEVVKEADDFILSSVKGDFCEEICALFTHVVLLEVPKATRLERMRERSYLKFGKRMKPGGDLYVQEEGFIKRMSERADDDAGKWAESMKLPCLILDGRKDILENVQSIEKFVLE